MSRPKKPSSNNGFFWEQKKFIERVMKIKTKTPWLWCWIPKCTEHSLDFHSPCHSRYIECICVLYAIVIAVVFERVKNKIPLFTKMLQQKTEVKPLAKHSVVISNFFPQIFSIINGTSSGQLIAIWQIIALLWNIKTHPTKENATRANPLNQSHYTWKWKHIDKSVPMNNEH